MSGMGIAGVLAAHREDATWPDSCVCQDNVPPGGFREGQYVDHVAHAIAAHLAEVLGGLREEVAEALSVAAGEMTAYSPTAHPDHNRWSWRGDGHGSAIREPYYDAADAVLGVVRAAMGLETASQPAQGKNRAAGEDECPQGADGEGEPRP